MLAPEFLPVWGGVGTYITDLVRHLPKDFEIHVVTPKRNAFGKEKMPALDYDFSRYFGSNVKIHFVSTAGDTFFYNSRFQNACYRYVPKLVKEENIDVIHSHTAHMPDIQLMFRRLGKPVVTTLHTTIRSQRLGTKLSKKKFSDFERSEKATYFMYPVLRVAEEIYFRRKRFYISPSNWMKQWLQDNYRINGNIRVISHSVEMKDFGSLDNIAVGKAVIPNDLRARKIVLYVGRLLAMKGVDTLIEAIPGILKKVPKNDFLFVFAGPGGSMRYVDRLKQKGVESSCFFTGPLDREATIQLMKAAEIVVVPSFLENSPYVVLESMACGTPVVASNVGGIPEIIENENNGLIVEPGSPDLLGDAVSSVLRDSSLRDSMVFRAKQTIIKNFSWDVNIGKYVDAYRDALAQRPL